MIHYHGLPITPGSAASKVLSAGHAFVSFRSPCQLGVVLEVAQSFAVDNGAFSSWKSGEPVTDWSEYYAWVAELHRYPSFDFAVIPDVIDGSEEDNDALLAEWSWGEPKNKWVGAPVYHLHESLGRAERLAYEYPRICIGSSGDYATIGDARWWARMAEVMNIVCGRDGRPLTKLHGLRMLNPDVFTRFPFSSVDSTNIAQNVGIDSAWRGTYTPASKEVRALVMRERIEQHQAPVFWTKTEVQQPLFI